MIPQMLSWGSAILELASTLSADDKEIQSAKGTLDTIDKAYNILNTSSVSASAGRSIISPLVLFEQSLQYQDFMSELMTIINMRDIRDALTHINYQSKIDGVRIGELVDSINPNRTAGMLCRNGLEAYYPPKNSVLAKPDNGNKGKDDGVSFEAAEFQGFKEYTPLAVGRTVGASVLHNGKPATFPLTFRQIPIPTTTANLELIFEAARGGEGWDIRVKDWKFGGITTPELLSGVDDIRREFKIRTQEMTGYYQEANARETRNRVESIRTGVLSVNSLANTIIMTKTTANKIEMDIGIKFGSSKMDVIRKFVKANTIVVVDLQYPNFTFYSMSSNIAERFTLADIRQKSKKEDVGSLEALIKVLNGR